MFTLRRHLRSLAWLALTTMLALVLLPGVSHALVVDQGDGRNLAEICTPQGMRTVVLDGGTGDEPVPLGANAGDCPCCSLAGHTPGLSQALALMLPPTEDRGKTPALFPQAPGTPFFWASAQPRAPPRAA